MAPPCAWSARQARPVAVITRLRLDAALYRPAPVRRPGQNGRPRLRGARLPSLARRLEQGRTRWQACQALVEDWNRPQEDAAWSHLQPDR